MAEGIWNLAESEKIIRLYNSKSSVHGHDCYLAWGRLQPGGIEVSARESVYIRLLFGAINRHGAQF